MKHNKFNLISALVLCYFAGNLNAAHVTVTKSLDPVAVMRFEILSQNLADQRKDKSLNLPVAIRKDIDAFFEGLGREPKEKDIASMQHQLFNKYGFKFADVIKELLDIKREGDAHTLRQLLIPTYGEQEEKLRIRFATDLVDIYIGKKRNAKGQTVKDRLEKAAPVIQTYIENFKIDKNALLASLFDYKKVIVNERVYGKRMSSDGSLIMTGDNRIFKRYGDEYRLQDQLLSEGDKEVYLDPSADLSVIIRRESGFDATDIYTLNPKVGTWELAQTVPYHGNFKISGDGSTIIIIVDETVHTYVREGQKSWREQKELRLKKSKNERLFITFISPDGLLFTAKKCVMHPDNPRLTVEMYTTYQRRGTSWEKLSDSSYKIQKRSARLYDQQKLAASHASEPDFDIISNDDGDIFVKVVSSGEVDIYTRYDDTWHFAQNIAEGIDIISSDGLVLGQIEDDYVYVIPMAAREAANKLTEPQWELINDLYAAQWQGLVLLTKKQLEFFNTLPEIFKKAIFAKWRVARCDERSAQQYKERSDLKSEASRRAVEPKRWRTAGDEK